MGDGQHDERGEERSEACDGREVVVNGVEDPPPPREGVSQHEERDQRCRVTTLDRRDIV
jgi:hypothetical protein